MNLRSTEHTSIIHNMSVRLLFGQNVKKRKHACQHDQKRESEADKSKEFLHLVAFHS